jgi:S1-C subfamily serine protease
VPTLLLAAALGPAVHAAPPPPVVGGQETDGWPTAALLEFRQGSAHTPLCSGVLVAADAVLTAAHCGDDLASLMAVGLGAWVVLDDVEREVLDVILHPDWDAETFEDDLALLLIEPVEGISPAPFTSEDPRPAWAQEGLTAVGFGDADEVGGGAGVKRVLALEVLEVDADFIKLDASGDANLCSGDSGGPVFREGPDGWELAGISAFIFRDDGRSGCAGGSTAAVRGDRAEEWVLAVRSGEEWDGIWSSPVGTLPPGPAEGCAVSGHRGAGGLALLSLLLVARRRRRADPAPAARSGARGHQMSRKARSTGEKPRPA